MTRETKIGLLVGLAFIIVIGILLSDFFHGRGEAPPATLDRAGATVRQGVAAPGVNQDNTPVTVVTPQQINPRSPVQTPGDIQPPTSPVVLAPPGNSQTGTQAPLPADDPLMRAAHQQGEELEPADNGGSTTAVAQRVYTAQSGDSVSRMAAKFMGANTYRNRQAIINANPPLQDDPDKVIVGQSYNIPTPAGSASSARAIAAAVNTSAPGSVYVVKSGDTLWGIATGQLGDAGAVATIKSLNRDVLHGSNSLRPGMKLRLPPTSVVVAD